MWRLQREDDAECRAFRKLVTGTEAPHRGTMQGTYVFSSQGKLLARKNVHKADVIAAMLKETLDSEMLQAPVESPSEPIDLPSATRWEDSYPEFGLALRKTVRDLPEDLDPQSDPARAFNRDAVWLSRSEALSLVPTHRHVGSKERIPRELEERIARFVLVDNARGQTIPYAPSEVKDSFIFVTIDKRRGDVLELKITGETSAVALGPWLLGPNDWKPKHEWPHAMWTRLEGRATWNVAKGQFTFFQVFASGWRRGRTVMCARKKDVPPGPIGFVLELAPASWRVAPAFVDLYETDWISDPRPSTEGAPPSEMRDRE